MSEIFSARPLDEPDSTATIVPPLTNFPLTSDEITPEYIAYTVRSGVQLVLGIGIAILVLQLLRSCYARYHLENVPSSKPQAMDRRTLKKLQ